jgi:hypothetical protein
LDKAFTPHLRQPSKALFCSKLLVLWTYDRFFFSRAAHYNHGTGVLFLTKVVMGRPYNVTAFGQVSSCPSGSDSVCIFVPNKNVMVKLNLCLHVRLSTTLLMATLLRSGEIAQYGLECSHANAVSDCGSSLSDSDMLYATALTTFECVVWLPQEPDHPWSLDMNQSPKKSFRHPCLACYR